MALFVLLISFIHLGSLGAPAAVSCLYRAENAYAFTAWKEAATDFWVDDDQRDLAELSKLEQHRPWNQPVAAYRIDSDTALAAAIQFLLDQDASMTAAANDMDAATAATIQQLPDEDDWIDSSSTCSSTSR